MKSDPRTDLLDEAAVARLQSRRPAGLGNRLVQALLLVAVPLLILAAASLLAQLLVRVGADIRIGLDPFLDERYRPRLSLYELAARGVAADLVRQALIVLFVLGLALVLDGAAWRRRLGLRSPAEPRAPIPRAWSFWLLLLVWPVIHIAWVAGTAEALHVSFGQGVRLSPFLTQTLIAASFAYVVLLAPLAEELLMRGEAYARARAFMGPAGAIATTALLFCVLHVGVALDGAQQIQFDQAWYARPITLLPLAVTLGWLRWRTGRLWPCFLLHGWSNAALITYLLWPILR